MGEGTSLLPAIEVGQTIPALEIEPVSRLTLALFAGASGDHNPIHIDLDYARGAGMDDVFAHGMLSMAWLGRMLTNWAPQMLLRHFQVRFVAITHVHERIICTGRVVERLAAGGEERLRLEVQTANQAGEVKLTGEAVLAVASSA